ncbi:MAG: hypothetical protein HUJ63_11195, partial [Enterococcus sp.]|nr:hypothetical protein [Enterococcus sp.]
MKKLFIGLLVAFFGSLIPFTSTFAAWNSEKACSLPNANPNLCGNASNTAPNLAIT